MDTIDKLQETRAGRRFLKREVARRSRCPFCGVSGKQLPEYGLGGHRSFAVHTMKHLKRGEKPKPEYQ